MERNTDTIADIAGRLEVITIVKNRINKQLDKAAAAAAAVVVSTKDATKDATKVKHASSRKNVKIDETSMQVAMTNTKSIDVDEPLSLLQMCLYYITLGNCYKALAQIPIIQHRYHCDDTDALFDSSCRSHYANECITAYENAKNESKAMDLCDYVSLLSITSYIHSICIFRDNFKLAKEVASDTFMRASDRTNTIDETSMNLLQHLRDAYMMPMDNPIAVVELNDSVYKVNHAAVGESIPIDLNSISPRATYDDNSHDSASLNKATVDRHNKKANKYESITKMIKNKTKEDNIRKKKNHDSSNKNDDDESSVDDMNTNIEHSPEGSKLFSDQIKVIVSVSGGPILLESVNSAVEIYTALENIFKTYVRGNTLPGQLTGGSSVSLGKGIGGQSLQFNTFLLQGPYMSWKGFVRFLIDFSIAYVPSNKASYGKTFPVTNAATFSLIKPPLSMFEVSAIFIECSKSIAPSLTIDKYIVEYKKMEEERKAAILSHSNTSHDSVLHLSSWELVSHWYQSNESDIWSISCGLNFMQFIDCIGKIGILAYTSSFFNDKLPTKLLKVSHFLTAHLGLLDERKWLKRIETKNKQTNEIIQQIMKSVAPTLPSAANTTNTNA